MFGDKKDTPQNLKDPEGKSSTSYGAGSSSVSFNLSYNKTNKLVTALYMVTDIVDKEEPLRNKLRTLGVDIISDIRALSGASGKVLDKISEAVSFLGIARTMNIISPMNCDILEKEFEELAHSIRESMSGTAVRQAPVDLNKFFQDSARAGGELTASRSQGHFSGPTRLGVQRGGTLLKALSRAEGMKALRASGDFARTPGDAGKHRAPADSTHSPKLSPELKGQRREDILNIIKINGGSATIKDIKDKISTMSDKNNPIVSLGEKTLQRELISMVEDGVLKKEGEKRWTTYFI